MNPDSARSAAIRRSADPSRTSSKPYVKVITFLAVKAYMGSTGIAPLIPYLGDSWR